MTTPECGDRHAGLRAGVRFVAIGLALYALLCAATERLLFHTGRANPIYKIETLDAPSVDWVVLGASHAMPLDFDGVNAGMEQDLGLRIVNLASPGAGPLYNCFVFEHFLHAHGARRMLYVLDSYAFEARDWNEDRFGDAKLLGRTPLAADVAWRFWEYVRRDGVDASALAGYLSGFAKVNNRDRFARDVWEGEAQFDRVARSSPGAVRKRIEYLYPHPADRAVQQRYLEDLGRIIDLARRRGMQVVVLKMPLPRGFRSQLPDEGAFDAAAAGLVRAHGAAWRDDSGDVDDAAAYFDTDHLNRGGVAQYYERRLRALLVAAPAAP